MVDIPTEKYVQYFKPKKLLMSFGLFFLAAAAIALVTPLLLGKNDTAFTLGGIIFFVLPLACLSIYKRSYIKEGKVFFENDNLQFTEQDIETSVSLDEIDAFSVKLTAQNFAGLTYGVSLLLKDRKKLDLFFVDNHLFESNNTISADSVLFGLALCFKKFNERLDKKDATEIKLVNRFKLSTAAWLFFFIPFMVIVVDIYYRIKHPEASQKVGVALVIMSFFLSLGTLARAKAYADFGKKVAALLEE
jgi:hypothetical protein